MGDQDGGRRRDLVRRRGGGLIVRRLALAAMVAAGLVSTSVRADFGFAGALIDGAGAVHGLLNAHGVVASRDGRHLYVGTIRGVGVFARDAGSAGLRALGIAPGPDFPPLDYVRSVVLSADGVYLYAAAHNGDAIGVFRRDAETGLLTSVAVYRDGVEGLRGVSVLVLSPDGRHLYAIAGRDRALVALARDGASGLLTPLQTLTDDRDGVDGLDLVTGLAITPDGTEVYVSSELPDSALAVFARDRATGRLRFDRALYNPEGAEDVARPHGVAVSTDGANLYVAANAFSPSVTVLRRAASGTLTVLEVEPLGTMGIARLVAVSPDGRNVYVGLDNLDAVVVFRREPPSGYLTYLNTITDGSDGVRGIAGPRGMGVTADGNGLLVTGWAASGLALFERQSPGGALEFRTALIEGDGGITGLRRASALAVSPDGAFVYAAAAEARGPTVFARDAATGGLQAVGVADGAESFYAWRGLALTPDATTLYGVTDVGWLVAMARDAGSGGLRVIDSAQDDRDGVDGLDGAYAVAVSPDQRHVYAGGREAALAIFGRDDSGAVAFQQAVEGAGLQSTVAAIAISGDGAYLYAAGYERDAVSVFARAGDGSLTFVQELRGGFGGIDGLRGASALTLSPDEAFLYVAASGDAAITTLARDAVSGRVRVVESQYDEDPRFASKNGVAVSPDGRWVIGIGNVAMTVFARDPVGGGLRRGETFFGGLDGVPGFGGANEVTFSPDGANVYIAAQLADALAIFRWQTPDGAVCGDDGGCESGHCTAATCCNLRCAGAGEVCALPDLPGTCVTRCGGDCDDDGTCTIDELVRAVGAALDDGDASCAMADLDGDGHIRINELVGAVNNALSGCHFDAAGTWRQDDLELLSSTCSRLLTDGFEQAIADGEFRCDYDIPGGAATATERCRLTTATYELSEDARGQLRLAASSRASQQGCTINSSVEIALDGRVSRTTATQTLTLRFSSGCRQRNCKLTLAGHWTRLPAGTAARRVALHAEPPAAGVPAAILSATARQLQRQSP